MFRVTLLAILFVRQMTVETAIDITLLEHRSMTIATTIDSDSLPGLMALAAVTLNFCMGGKASQSFVP